MGLSLAWTAAPAFAQVAGEVSVQSDYRVRGYSASEGRAVAVLDLSYDSPSGVYVNGTAVAATPRREEADLPLAMVNVGYARRISPQTSFDAGVMRTQYFRGPDESRGTGYTEVYLGLSGRNLSAHLFYSPDYFQNDSSTLYAALDGSVEPIPKLRLNAHLGLLGWMATPAYVPGTPPQYDWRVGISRQVGLVDLRASVSGGGPSSDYYEGRHHTKTAFVVGAGVSF